MKVTTEVISDGGALLCMKLEHGSVCRISGRKYMLNQVETMFDGMTGMMKKLKKATYEKNMNMFREKYGHFFEEMAQYVEENDYKEAAAKEIAVVYTEAVKDKFSVRGRVKAYVQADLNLFMVYYVFPAILLIESEYNDLIARCIRDEWEAAFQDSRLGYVDYDQIYSGFREKIFGIF